MMSIARGLLANDAGLLSEKHQVGLAALTEQLFGIGKLGLLRRQRWVRARSRIRKQLRRHSGIRSEDVGCGAGNAIELDLIGGLNCPSIHLQESVLERKADLRPSEKLLASPQSFELVQQMSSELSGSLRL